MIKSTTRFLALATLFSTGCWQAPPNDDAGDEAFATWATVSVLGRRPFSMIEVGVLGDLADRSGREAVLDVLMSDPGFETYWNELLLEDLQVALDGVQEPDDHDCYTDTDLPSYYDPALVEHLSTSSPLEPFCPETPEPIDDYVVPSASGALPSPDVESSPLQLAVDSARSGRSTGSGRTMGYVAPTGTSTAHKRTCRTFTMRDVVRASLAADRLDTIYLAYLGPMVMNTTQTGILTDKFSSVYANRDAECMYCHTTHYSTTNGVPRNEHWDRYEAPSPVDLEASTFSWQDSEVGFRYGGDGGDEVSDQIRAFFRPTVRSDDGIQPWGMSESCMVNGSRTGLVQSPGLDPDQPDFAAMAGIQGDDVGPLQLMDTLRGGTQSFSILSPSVGLTEIPEAFQGGSVRSGANIVGGCNSQCHNQEASENPAHGGYRAPFPLESYTLEITPNRLDQIREHGSPAGLMGKNLWAESQTKDIYAYLASRPGYDASVSYSDPSHGLTHLMAMRIVDTVYKRISGASLTLGHRYPRNEDAAMVLRVLTNEFVDNGWSLRVLVKRITLSKLGNRRAPLDSTHNLYELPMLIEPWADVPGDGDTSEGEDANGQGDLVHRWPVASLIRQRNVALGWPEGDYFSDSELKKAMGAYTDFDDKGFDEVLIASLLEWEDDLNGCNRPGTDYIDALLAEEGITYRRVIEALKGRLLTDGKMYADYSEEEPEPEPPPPSDPGSTLQAYPTPPEPTGPTGYALLDPDEEWTAIEVTFGIDLNDPAEDDTAIRAVCTAILMSPQFMLSGLPAWDDGDPPEHDHSLPCVDELCSEGDYCAAYRETAAKHGYADNYPCGSEGAVGWEAIP